MAQTTSLYQCHRCGTEWTRESEVLQADDCANCGQANVSPFSETVQEHDERDTGDMDHDAGDVGIDADLTFGAVEDEWN